MNGLKEIRKLLRLSLADLAKEFEKRGYKISRQALSQMENGDIKISEERLEQLSEILSIPSYYFLKEIITNEDKEEIKKFRVKEEAKELLGGEIKLKNGKLYYFSKIENWLENGEVEEDGEWIQIKSENQINDLYSLKINSINAIVYGDWFEYRHKLKQILDELIIIEDYIQILNNGKYNNLESFLNYIKNDKYPKDVIEKYNINQEELQILKSTDKEIKITSDLEEKLIKMTEEEKRKFFKFVYN